MEYIMFIVGDKVVLIEWNKNRLNDKEFEDLWTGNHEGNIEAKRRDSIRNLKSVATDNNIGHDLLDWTKSEDNILNQMEGLRDKSND